MLGDITLYQTSKGTSMGSRKHQVASGSAASINSGEPVGKTLGSQYVATLATSKPVVGTDYLAGIATTTSTDTASAAGSVDVVPVSPEDIWVINPKVAATWGLTQGSTSQSTYNALQGARVLLDKTSSTYTILATDSANNGCVVEYIDVNSGPAGKVAFSFRAGASYLA